VQVDAQVRTHVATHRGSQATRPQVAHAQGRDPRQVQMMAEASPNESTVSSYPVSEGSAVVSVCHRPQIGFAAKVSGLLHAKPQIGKLSLAIAATTAAVACTPASTDAVLGSTTTDLGQAPAVANALVAAGVVALAVALAAAFAATRLGALAAAHTAALALAALVVLCAVALAAASAATRLGTPAAAHTAALATAFVVLCAGTPAAAASLVELSHLVPDARTAAAALAVDFAVEPMPIIGSVLVAPLAAALAVDFDEEPMPIICSTVWWAFVLVAPLAAALAAALVLGALVEGHVLAQATHPPVVIVVVPVGFALLADFVESGAARVLPAAALAESPMLGSAPPLAQVGVPLSHGSTA
jgi:hypothetical protein